MEHFVSGSTARTAARRCWVKRKTAAGFFCRLRESIVLEPEAESEALCGDGIEGEESDSGGQRKGRRGRSAAGKVPVFGLLQWAGKVYTRIIPDASSDTPMPIIEGKVMPDSIVCCEGRKGCNALAVSDFPPQDQPLRTLRGRPQSHQRDGEFLVPGKATHAPFQRYPEGPFRPVFAGM